MDARLKREEACKVVALDGAPGEGKHVEKLAQNASVEITSKLLSTQVVEALSEIQAVTGRYSLVFPGRNDITKPMSEASINQVLKRVGYHGKATGHGFRHTVGTILHEQSYNTAWIELQLAHVDKNTIRGTYNHAQYLEQRREMLQWYGDYVQGLVKINGIEILKIV